MSATLVSVVRGLYAIGAVDLNGPDSSVEYTINRGLTAVSNPAVGRYIITTHEAIDVFEAASVLVQCYGLVMATALVSQSPTQLLNSEFEIDLIGPFSGVEGASIPIDVPFAFQVQDVNPE